MAAVVVLPFVAETTTAPCGSRAARRSSAPGSIVASSLPGSVVPPPVRASRESPPDGARGDAGEGGDGHAAAPRASLAAAIGPAATRSNLHLSAIVI